MSTIVENYREVVGTIPGGVKLVAVSKTKPVDQIMELYECGQRTFGESKVQEMTSKFEQLPQDIEWHMIGHLQTNKVKYIAPFVSLIHSVDSMKLLKVIDKEGAKNNRVIDCLLQMHIAEEETKFGFDYDEVAELLGSEEYKAMQHIRITGLMCMATFTDDQAQIRREFGLLSDFFHRVKDGFFKGKDYFRERSMGMSDDYLLAMEKGSTMVRIGSVIFGHR